MKFYPLCENEQLAIRHLGMQKYCYHGETKKTLRFCNSVTKEWIYWDREGESNALVIPRDDITVFGAVEGVVEASQRSSSNFRMFPKQITSRGKINFTGLRLVLRHPSWVHRVVTVMQERPA